MLCPLSPLAKRAVATRSGRERSGFVRAATGYRGAVEAGDVLDDVERVPRSISRQGAASYLRSVSERIEQLSQRRNALRWSLAPTCPERDELDEIERRIGRLWETYRWLRATATHGTRAEIARRARRDADLERSLDDEIRRVALDRARHSP